MYVFLLMPLAFKFLMHHFSVVKSVSDKTRKKFSPFEWCTPPFVCGYRKLCDVWITKNVFFFLYYFYSSAVKYSHGNNKKSILHFFYRNSDVLKWNVKFVTEIAYVNSLKTGGISSSWCLIKNDNGFRGKMWIRPR